MNDMNKINSVFERIESPDIALLREIGKRIGFGRACQILGEQWDDMLEKEWGLPRGRGKMERRNDIEAIEAVIATHIASQESIAQPELPQMREYGEACARAALSASGQTAQAAMPNFDDGAAKRLRQVCKLVGLEKAVPESDAELWGCAFSVLGMIRHNLSRAPSQPQQEAVPAEPRETMIVRFALSEAQKATIRRAAEALEGLDYEDTAGDLRAILTAHTHQE